MGAKIITFEACTRAVIAPQVYDTYVNVMEERVKEVTQEKKNAINVPEIQEREEVEVTYKACTHVVNAAHVNDNEMEK